MEKIVLNIGLKTNTYNRPIDAKMAVSEVLEVFNLEKELSFEVVESSYNGQIENCLIVGISENIGIKDLEKNLKILCSELLQDCISYYDMQTGLGDLVWNDQIKPYLSFDKDYMKFGKPLKRECKYKEGFEELLCYFDSISEDEQPKIAKKLEELGLI